VCGCPGDIRVSARRPKRPERDVRLGQCVGDALTVGYTIVVIGEVGAGMAYVRGGHAPHHVLAKLLLQYH
jgi:hypothetical protein